MSEHQQEAEISGYMVVINHEEQYSLWPVDAPRLPKSWKPAGYEGPLEKAQAYIEEVWTDMRPLSLRKALEEYGSVEKIPKEVWTDMRP